MALYQCSRSILMGSLFILSLLASVNAVCARNMFDAQMYYQEGRYRCAADELEGLVREHKDTAETHYLLGNTYVCLKLLPEAKVEYNLALAQNAKGKVKEHCLNALARMGTVRNLPMSTAIAGAMPKPTAAALANEAERTALASRLESASQSESARREEATQKQMAAILSDAEKRADAVRQEAKARLAEYKDSSSQYWRERDTGRIVWELDPALEQQFMAPYEHEISRILEDGHRRAEGLASTSAGSRNLVESAASLNRQVMSQSSGGKGPQIDLARSNLYTRTYNTSKTTPQSGANMSSGLAQAGTSGNSTNSGPSSAAPKASTTMMAGKETATH